MHRRTLATAMLIASAGALGFLGLSCARASDAVFPTINVTATLPGRSAETVARSIATPLEREFSKIAGVKSLTSSSRQGETSITIQFEPSRGMDAASHDVQAAIAKAQSKLPPEITSSLIFTKGDPTEPPILYLPVVSETLPLWETDYFAESVMAPRIAMVSGVGRVLVYGAAKYAIRVQLIPDALAKYSLSLDQMEAAVQGGVRLQPPKNSSELRQLTVASRDGRPVTLEQIGQLIDSVEDERTAAWYNDRRVVILGVQRQPGSNAAEVAAAVRKLLPDFRAKIPQSISFDVVENLPGTDSILGFVETSSGTSYDRMIEYQRAAANLVRHDPAVESSISIVNGDKGHLFLQLKPLKERRRDVDEIVEELRKPLAQFPAFRVYLRKTGTEPQRYILTGADFGELAKCRDLVASKLFALSEVRNLTDDFHPGLSLSVNVDRDKARALGINTARIETALSILNGGLRVSDEPPAILELQPAWLDRPEALSKLYISGEGDKLVHLDTLARMEMSRGPREVHHTGLLPSVTISFDLRPGGNIDKAIAEIRLPATVKGRFVKN